MNNKTFLLAFGLGLASLSSQAADNGRSMVYIGTRAAPAQTSGPQGIYLARLDNKTGRLTAMGMPIEMRGVSWLVAHPTKPLLFTVVNPSGNTTAESVMYSYAIEKATGMPRQVSQVGTGGRDTTHMTFDARSNTLFGSSFGSGEVMSVPVQPDGQLGKLVSTYQHEGQGPHPRQASPHAHSVAVDPTGRYLVSADMGADRVYVNRFDAATRMLTAGDPPFYASEPGTGPRHLAFHPNGKFLYVNTELTAEVRAYRWDSKRGKLELVESKSAYPEGYSGPDKSSSEIGLGPDGRHLYLTLRGNQDAIVMYDVDARTGRLKEAQRIPSQGKSPRSYAIDRTGRWFVVVHDVSSTVNVFAIDKSTGKLTPAGEPVNVPNAASVAFVAD